MGSAFFVRPCKLELAVSGLLKYIEARQFSTRWIHPMKSKWFVALLCLSITACNSDKSPSSLSENGSGKNESVSSDSEPSEPAPAVEDLEEKYKAEMDAFITAYRAADESERQKVLAEKYPKTDDYCAAMIKLAESTSDIEASFKAYFWIATNARDSETTAMAYDKLLNNHIDRIDLKKICLPMAYKDPSEVTESQLRKLAEQSPHHDVKGMATFSLGNYLDRTAAVVKRIEEKPDKHGQTEEIVAYVKALDSSPETISAIYQKVLDEYGDVALDGTDQTLSHLANGALFEIDSLAIGMKVPEIEGEDIDGTEFKLSDYHGKVVVIDFWGDW